jgi:1-deoxy-D-xylulose-5-phosphate synthase
MTILAPAGEEELIQMLRWAASGIGPVIIRYPKALCPAGDPAFSAPLEKGRGVWVRRGQPRKNACVMFTGGLYHEVIEGAEILESRGIGADLYNLRFLKPVDEDYLAEIMNQYEMAVFAEEGSRNGGFGEYAASLALRRNCSCKVIILGTEEKFDALGKREELLRRNGLDAEGIVRSFESSILSETLIKIPSREDTRAQRSFYQ